MLKFATTTRFDKDVKKLRKRGKDLSKLQRVVEMLQREETLPPKYKLHKLTGNWYPCWDCHIEPDWILIWALEDDVIVLTRTGSHSDLF